jgi:hypothetical protein
MQRTHNSELTSGKIPGNILYHTRKQGDFQSEYSERLWVFLINIKTLQFITLVFRVWPSNPPPPPPPPPPTRCSKRVKDNVVLEINTVANIEHPCPKPNSVTTWATWHLSFALHLEQTFVTTAVWKCTSTCCITCMYVIIYNY